MLVIVLVFLFVYENFVMSDAVFCSVCFQENTAKGRVITDSFVTDSVLVWPYQVNNTLRTTKLSIYY